MNENKKDTKTINPFHFPINKDLISKEFLAQFEIKNPDFIVDRFEQMVMQDIIQFDESLLQKLNRNVTKDLMDWFNDKLKSKENVSLSIIGGTRSISKGQKVLMSDYTYKNIELVKVNDKIVTINEKTNKLEIKPVLINYYSGIKYEFELMTFGNKNIKCSNEHKFYTKENSYISLKNLKPQNLVTIPYKFKLNKPTKLNLYFAELLGYLLGDGGLTCSKVTFYSSYPEVIKKINYLSTELKYQLIKRKNREIDYYFKAINNKKSLTKELKKLNLIGVNSFTKFIPNEILYCNNNLIYYKLLSGLFATDGWVSDKLLGYSSRSKILIKNIAHILFLLGVDYNYREFNKVSGFNPKLKMMYQIDIIRYQGLKLIYDNCDLNWKHKKLKLLIEKKSLNKLGGNNYQFYKNDLFFKKIKSIKPTKKKVEMYDLLIKDNHNFICNSLVVSNSGKSLASLKLMDNLCRIYNKPFDTNWIVCGNQNEYRIKLMDATEGDMFQIDENAFAQVGDGANTERSQLLDVQNIIAKMNIHNIYITPKRFMDNNAQYGLKFYGKDTKNWVSKFLLYKLGGFNPILLGYVTIDVGKIFADYGCFFYKSLGSCTNPNRLILKDITETQLIYENTKNINNIKEVRHSIDYLNYSSCIPNESKNIISQKESFKNEKKSPCPFYHLCKHPLADYEKKKDKWIAEEMSGGMGARQKERFRVGLKLIQRLGAYNTDKNKFLIKASGKANAEIKIKLLLPELTNTKFNKTEFVELFNIITSLGEVDVFKQTMKHLNLEFKEELLKIENGELLIGLLEEIKKD